MKKNKFVLFTLLLSVMGAVGSVRAESIKAESRSFRIENSANKKIVSSSSSNSTRDIIGTSRLKKGENIKILLPNGKFNGQTTTVKIYANGILIGTLYLTYGDAYAVIVFNPNADSEDISRFISNFGSFNFGTIGAGGIIDIDGGTINASSSASSISMSSNRNHDNVASLASNGSLASTASSSTSKDNTNSRSSSSSKIVSASTSSSKGNSFFSSSSNEESASFHHSNKGPGPVIINPLMSAWSGSSVIQHSKNKSSSLDTKVSSALTSTKDEGKGIRRHLVSMQDKSNWRQDSRVSSRIEKKAMVSETGNSSKKDSIIDSSGRLHLTKQQVQQLQKSTRFDNSKVARATSEAHRIMNSNNHKVTVHPSTKVIIRNGKITIHREKEKAGKHSASHIRRVNLPIRGILPATRMDKNTWLYSLIGLLIMIVSGKELFSKNQK